MESITLENFRCFREKQTVKLAPLTLLVGENSTGKTSFQALIQALAEYAFEGVEPHFKKAPFDLGSFEEIVHTPANGRERAELFEAAMTGQVIWGSLDSKSEPNPTLTSLRLTFRKPSRGTVPTLVRQRTAAGETWIDEQVSREQEEYKATLHTQSGEWSLSLDSKDFGAVGLFLRIHDAFETDLPRITFPYNPLDPFVPLGNSPALSKRDVRELRQLDFSREPVFAYEAPYLGIAAIAPIRSRPLRTYEPSLIEPDPEGNSVVSYLGDLAFRRDPEWQWLKGRLETVGRQLELFHEIDVRFLGSSSGDPVQLRVRVVDEGQEGMLHKLADVGYGVSQAIPLIVELLRPKGAAQFLIQQPEVHLHPRAQAELGSLFCEVAAQGRQLIVETHSDHLMDRIRMDVRDGKTDLRPEDVRILYFERDGLDVKIHEIWYDDMGNLENTPPGYRRFFMEEVDRSLWGPQ